MDSPEDDLPQRVVTIDRVPTDGKTVGGEIGITEEAVATIARVAASTVPGVHAIGRWRFIPFFDWLRRSVVAEVGKREAALDLEIVLEFGADIRELASTVRAAIAEAIDQMAGRKVVEVNLKVVGIVLPGEEDREPPGGRVR